MVVLIRSIVTATVFVVVVVVVVVVSVLTLFPVFRFAVGSFFDVAFLLFLFAFSL